MIAADYEKLRGSLPLRRYIFVLLATTKSPGKSTILGAPSSFLMISFIVPSVANLGHAFVFASGFRKAASPASDTSTHFGSAEASTP
jgi:hypothetical protein